MDIHRIRGDGMGRGGIGSGGDDRPKGDAVSAAVELVLAQTGSDFFFTHANFYFGQQTFHRLLRDVDGLLHRRNFRRFFDGPQPH